MAECAVIDAADALKGRLPRGFVVLKAGVDRNPDEITRELATMVREQIGPVAALKDIAVVGGLPKTRSGKILRKTMCEIAGGQQATIPLTIEDESVLERLRPALRRG